MIRLLVLLVLAWPLGASAQGPNASPMPGSFSAQQRAEIIETIRHALKTDPSILRDAVAALQADEGLRQQEAARGVIAGHATALLRDAADPIAGAADGDVTIVEFYDVRCPYCRRMVPVMNDLIRADRHVRIVYKDIPILGPASVLGAKALLAAQRQGGYLRLREALMTGPATLDDTTLRSAADRLGLDWRRLQRDMADPAIAARLDANVQLAHALAIEGTPVYVVGQQMLTGAMELDAMRDAVSQERRH